MKLPVLDTVDVKKFTRQCLNYFLGFFDHLWREAADELIKLGEGADIFLVLQEVEMIELVIATCGVADSHGDID